MPMSPLVGLLFAFSPAWAARAGAPEAKLSLGTMRGTWAMGGCVRARVAREHTRRATPLTTSARTAMQDCGQLSRRTVRRSSHWEAEVPSR